MFEREIKFIYDFNLNKVNRLGPYFTFEQLSRIDVHPAILNYISAEIDFLIFEDRQNLLKNSVFDYSGEKITNYFNLISEEVKKSKRFSLEYISKLILHASSFTVNYLVRPKWTLSKFVFDESDHKTTLEIKQILNYIYYYQYLKKILISYINSKKIISMNSEEFINLLDRVNKLGIETYLPNILSQAVRSIADFFNIGEIQKNKIPFLAIEKFLEEKNLNDHLRRIYSVFGEDKTVKINTLDLQKTLDSVMIEKIEQPAETVNEHEEVKEEIQPISGKEEYDLEHQEATKEKEEVVIDNESDESDTVRPKKLRIRIDKNNEIEPIDEEDEIKKVEEIINAPEPDTEKHIQDLTEHKNVIEERDEDKIEESIVEDEQEIDDETEIVRSINEENYEMIDVQKEIDESEGLNEEEFDETQKIDHTGDEEEFQSTKVEEQDLEEPDNPVESEEMIVDELHPDKVYDQILKEESETEESMLQTILQNNKEESDESSTIMKEDSLEELSKPKIDVAELLEHKEMTKIIETIFDYDIEEFANSLDEISSCQSFDDAVVVINQTLKNRNISGSSKEAEMFKSIISKYFPEK